MDYGLWLLIALLVVIGIMFLLSGRKSPEDVLPPEVVAPPVMEKTPTVAAPVAPVEPIADPIPAPGITSVAFADVPVAPTPMIEPVAIPLSPAVATPAEQPDDLLKLKGVGPKLNTLLIELGVTRFAQIAAWTDQDIATIDARLGTFKGRPTRDQWIDQAKYLASGDIAGFEAKYGKL